ncbi:hypothetical protein SULPSESMR1_01194 [Pseudosulfitobacter pseudonitzschiae]|uniref:Uncharacterized protein n=1 Tax=Pseudosulfitobacter pseudonitzschiae TaxID=1402135 RepID=A0A221JZ60_9RHOB|nr:hypothetical protein SULPSESMR1_01194 [Pseudosulfitobacter pseudonitzschiae]
MSSGRELETYRVRYDFIGSPNYGHHRLRWIAERRIKPFWLIAIWRPVSKAPWRDRPNDAWDDAARDYDLRQSLHHARKDT